MYRRPFVGEPRTARTSRVTPMPAPVRGWNARDSITDMDPQDCINIDNFFPGDDELFVRRGFTSYATGLGTYVQSLMAWSGGGSDKLKAAAGSNIYDVTSTGAVGAAEVSSLTNAKWQHVNFETAGGNFLVICNGEDSVRNYDGTNWTTPTINNVTSSTLIHVNAHKERLWFTQVDTMNAWYLPVNSISGNATKFALGAVFKKGGVLQAMGTWTFDGGAGIDDYAVFISSKGEVAIYQGTDPSSANTWALVGVYEIGAPIGRRCLFKVAGELVIITNDGFQLLSSALANARTRTNQSYSDRIRRAVRDAARAYNGNFGWQAILYPKGGMGIFNVPVVESGTTEQYVVNTNTNSWTKFTGMDANSWEVYNDELYFGGNGAVYKADSGFDDDGADIQADLETAFSHLGNRGSIKRFLMVRPLIKTDGSEPAVGLAVNVDYSSGAPLTTPSFSGTGGTPWGSAWGSPWSRTGYVKTDWISVEGEGRTASLRLRLTQNGIEVSLTAIDWLTETGGVI